MKQGSEKEDIRLWKRLLKSDRNAFSMLFRKYYNPLFNYGLKLIPKKELVKDSIQELFISIWEQRNSLSEVDYVRTYLYVSFRRTLFRQDEIQKARNRRDQTYSEELISVMLSYEKLIILNELQEEQKKRLRAGLNSLSEREKEALFLKFYDGFSNAEISQVMEVNGQSVYNYIYRAIQALKAYLDGYEQRSENM